MPEPRLVRLDTESALAIGRAYGFADSRATSELFRLLLHNPALAERMDGLLGYLLGSDVLDPIMRELAVLRVGWVSGTEYMWTQHYKIAHGLGILDEEIAAVRDFPHAAAPRGAAGAAVLRATDEVLADGVVGGHTWSQLRQHLDTDAACVELLVAVSNWRMLAVLMRSLEVPNEPNLPTWPPDGRMPG